MEFKLDPYRRDIPEETLLADLVEVSKRLGKNGITEREYNKIGIYSSGTFRKRFGSWNIAMEKAGLIAPGNWHNIPDASYTEDLKRVASLLGKRAVTQAEYDDTGKYSSGALSDRFGSWFGALDAAGLDRTRNLGITNDQYFLNLEKVWRTLGRQPKGSEMRKPLSSYSVDAYADRFGTWRKALEKFVEFVNHGPELPATGDSKTDRDVSTKTAQPPEQEDLKRGRYISWRLRFLVMRRDGFRCRNCGRSPAVEPGVVLHVDHTKAWSKGGPTTYDNLCTLCSVCNIGKSDLEPEQEQS
jgi:hypothetical protein